MNEYVSLAMDCLNNKMEKNDVGMIQTYSPGAIQGQDCSEVVQCKRHDTYDNSLAAILSMSQGGPGGRELATSILNGMREARKLGKVGTKGYLFASYSGNVIEQAEDQTGYDYTLDTGNNAWAAIAMHLGSEKIDTSFEEEAGILEKGINESLCTPSEGSQGLECYIGRPDPNLLYQWYCSTEHHIDIYALAILRGNEVMKQKAASFLEKMKIRDRQDTYYSVGTTVSPKNERECPSQPNANIQQIPTDANVWSVLSGAEGGTSTLEWVNENVFVNSSVDNVVVPGYKFSSDSDSNLHIQFEITGSSLLAMEEGGVQPQTGVRETVKSFFDTPSSSFGIPNKTGCIPATFPKETPTGYGYAYFPYFHTASTVWCASALSRFNPYKGTNVN